MVLLIVILPALPDTVRRPAMGAGVAFVLPVGVSRVPPGVHWASDVLGGWLLASAWPLATAAALRRRRVPIVPPDTLEDPMSAGASVRDLPR